MNKLIGLFSQYKGLRKEVYVLFFGRIVTNLGSMVFPMLTMILSRKLGLDAAKISILMVAAMALMMPANLLGGALADRFNKKNVIVYCDLVSVACYVASAFVPLGYGTIALTVLAALFQTMEGPSYNALLADLTATRDRQRAYSLLYLGGNLGLVLSPTLAGLLFENHLWLSFLISGVAIGLSTLLIWLRIRDVTPEPDEGEEAVYQKGRSGESLWSILKSCRVVLVFLLIGALYESAYSQYSFLMPLDMGRVHGENGALLYGTVSSLNCIIVVLFTPLITRVFRRLTELQKALCGMLLIAAGYGLFLSLLGRVPAYYAAMLLFTWGEIFITIMSGPYTTSRVPASHRGRVQSVMGVAGGVVSAVCELATGHLYEGVAPAAAWTLVLCLLAFAVLGCLILMPVDRKTYPKLYENGKEKTENEGEA